MSVQFVSENQRAEVLLTDYARQLTGGGGKPSQGLPSGVDDVLPAPGRGARRDGENTVTGRGGQRETAGCGDGADGGRVVHALDGQAAVDLLCGGFPCQDVSVAGRRAGLAGARSGLFFEFARIADELVRPGGWVVVENVPGLLSSNGGRDFAVVIRTLGDIGFHDLAWRVLDSRYFGVPQRRRRVFIVGRRAAGTGARQVLLEPESGGGDFAPSRQARPRVAASLSRGSSGPGVSAPGRRQEDDENIVANALDLARGGADDNDAQGNRLVAHTLRAEGFDASEDGTGRGTPLVARALTTGQRYDGDTEDFLCAPVDSDGVRAATGIPGWLVDPPPDGPRYAAMGNAVTVNVAKWIGRRIVSYEEAQP